MHELYCKKYGSGYCFLVLPREGKTSIEARIKQLGERQHDPQDIRDGISKHLVCEWGDVRPLQKL